MPRQVTAAPASLQAAMRELRAQALPVALFSMGSNVLMLVPALYMMQVFDRVLNGRSELTLLALSLITLFLLALMAACEWARAQVLAHAAGRLEEGLAGPVLQASLDAALRGEEAAAGAQDLQKVRQFVSGPGMFALFDLPWTPVYVLAAYLLHPLLGVVAAVFLLAQAALAGFGQRLTVAPSEAAAQASSDARRVLEDGLRHAETIEPMGLLGALGRRWRAHEEAAVAARAESLRVSNRVIAWSRFLRSIQQSLALAAGALLVIDGQLSASAMIAVTLLVNRALVPVDQMVAAWRPLLAARAAWRRLRTLVGQQALAADGQRRDAIAGAVALRGVEARAPGGEVPLLHDITFQVPAGTLVAVLGPSGAGKSILARVLAGAWPRVAGEVLLDGRPMAEWDRVALGPQQGYLPQEVELFDATIAENIGRLGDLQPDAVVAAARAAGLHETILRQPKGYDTPLGEAGRLVSGGLRQRIGLARALYGAPRLLVLDEPDAHLDEDGLRALRRALQQLKARDCTVFVMTHLRSGLPSLADRVLVLHEGRLVQDGVAEAVLAILRAARPPTPAMDTIQPAMAQGS